LDQEEIAPENFAGEHFNCGNKLPAESSFAMTHHRALFHEQIVSAWTGKSV
jgi:hypothetical protein